ncbi:unnamed protein product [Thelazia callipaeda]|uniref:GRIP domain-containing protein n=1 Tax=Thelazia callipaeda TaxID=103827 RepID=A0A0N5CN88_THECL|nr:unnamed protein product [Thelazia callipaeda]
MNYTLQSQFARAERDLANSLLEKAQIKIENQCLHNGIKRSQQNLKEITDTLQEIISRNAIKNQEWNWRMKRDLHARRSIEKKLRDATGTRVAKCNRSDQLQSKGLLERNSSNSEMDLSVKLKSCEERKEYQGDRNDSASRMKMDRKLTEAKCEIAKLKAKNRQLQRLCEDAQVNGQNYNEIQGMMDAVVNDIEIQNAKHTKVVQQMKKSLKHEISSLILNTIQNSTVIQQKLDLIDSLAFENSQITSKLEELQDSILKLAQTLCQVDTMHETQLKQPNVCAVDEKNCIARTVNYLNVLEHNAILRKQNLLFQDIIYSALGHIPAICDLMTFILENTNVSINHCVDKFIKKLVFERNKTLVPF